MPLLRVLHKTHDAKMWATPKTSSPSLTWGPREVVWKRRDASQRKIQLERACSTTTGTYSSGLSSDDLSFLGSCGNELETGQRSAVRVQSTRLPSPPPRPPTDNSAAVATAVRFPIVPTKTITMSPTRAVVVSGGRASVVVRARRAKRRVPNARLLPARLCPSSTSMPSIPSLPSLPCPPARRPALPPPRKSPFLPLEKLAAWVASTAPVRRRSTVVVQTGSED